MKRRIISFIISAAMAVTLLPFFALTVSAAGTPPTIKLGDYVTMGGYKWRCVAFEKATRQADGSIVIDSTETSNTYQTVGNNTGDTGYLPLMFADDTVGFRKQFDAQGSSTTGSHGRGSTGIRTSWGSNYWGDSNIRDWLNSADKTVAYTCGNAPSGYKDAAGFLRHFNSAEKAAMQTVTQKSLLAAADKDISGASGDAVHTYASSISNVVQNYSSAYSELITDTMFLLDVQQVYNVYSNDASLGGTGYYKCSSSTYPYWLRSPVCNELDDVRVVYYSGNVGSKGSAVDWTDTTGQYVRPAFFLNLSNPFVGLDGSGTEDEPYTVVHKHVLTYHAKVDATCTSSGTGEYWKCEGGDGCNKYFSDANGTTQISSPPYIRPKGHTWSEWVTTKEPTETAKGEKERECSVCHTKETKEVAAFNDLNIGDYLEMGTYDTDGDGTTEPILWRCVAFEKATRRADGSIEIDSTDTQTKYTTVGKNEGDTGYLPLMLADTAIGKPKAFDAKGENTSGSHGTQSSDRTKYGSNYWGDSNIRDWLNSADKTVTYTCGNAPAYNEEAGFLTNFNSAEKAAMVEVTQKALINRSDFNAIEDTTIKSGSANHTVNSSITSVVQNYANAYSMQIKDTMFLLDVQQLYNAQKNSISWKLTDTGYWLRTPDCSTNYNERYVSTSSSSIDVGSGYAYSRQGVRPAFFFDLSSVEFEGGDGAKENPHTIPKPPHYHTLMHYEAAAPTCTASGNREYWKCEGDEGCGKYFSDENGETETTLENTVINAKGHTWGAWTITTAPTFTTTGTAERVCVNNPNHTESVELPVLTDTTFWEEGDYTAPTETTDGSQVYTSEYGSVTVVLPATGPGSFSVRYEDGKAVVTASKAGTCAVLFAAYDADGRLTSLLFRTVSVEEGETTVTPENFTANGTVKVMLWERLSSMKPLCGTGGN